jgi:hypothetical protein
LAIDKDPTGGKIDMSRSTKPSRPVVLMSAVASVAPLANRSGPSAADQSAAAEPDLGIVRSVSSGADIILRVDAYYLSKDEDLLLQRVERTLSGDCMHRFGVEYQADPRYPARAIALRKRLFDFVDAAESASFGYQAVESHATELPAYTKAKPEQLTGAARLAGEK